jgi:antitoxin ParD1/3/4
VLPNYGNTLEALMSKNTSIVLGDAQEAFLKRQVASGRFNNTSEAVRASISALMERDAAVDRWLHTEAAPVYDAIIADPSRALPLESAFDDVILHNSRRADTAA